ncbi:Protein of unknown function [Pyronema omphalodes CBS 100304]|uniref:Uncharacterized protein n=1 Tax=Pyronema omphalodes (strain CBS 100304) TaxID=1076935 RepID=U4L906_PYROM|nr:Protein of unknown function [Pyronema omphalodes CBS 100304]
MRPKIDIQHVTQLLGRPVLPELGEDWSGTSLSRRLQSVGDPRFSRSSTTRESAIVTLASKQKRCNQSVIRIPPRAISL